MRIAPISDEAVPASQCIQQMPRSQRSPRQFSFDALILMGALVLSGMNVLVMEIFSDPNPPPFTCLV